MRGGNGTMNRRMMRQAQQLQRRMAELQEELESATVEATAAGGVVSVVVSGKMTVESITIDPEVVSPDDVDILEDLVTAAVNEGLAKAQEMANSKMSELTGGLNIPGLT
ncbi:MAG: YbaB/EbfC family nucleoid-associated protein [Dehalococcoidia bacterium]|nr:YbaB/EbfC family nucleoid-associated protein [Dehalococcoidia bacterium]